jgi:hypothetical protein
MITTICKTINEFHYKVLEKALSSHVIGISCKDDNIFSRFFVGFFFKCSNHLQNEWIAIDIKDISEDKNSIAVASKRMALMLILQSAIEGKKEEIGKILDATVEGNFAALDPMGETHNDDLDAIESGENPFTLVDLK